ncbi:PTS sugar transporter subunit IIA [Candidatus Enterococcus ferrettii]|uniref:Ascorbate-specific PTS system EIIA component n=1 Tax=Candidatus Enterococcus ferrettii TaxID=2815324 RepID=A0ABV0EVQ7_9ENTE|nr:PTS sugar transporter subunit IIA [Enterococcus sp. 665A]MBO1342328.1 PTS sugar transporter subunit IIA [Enterococcus sp. 665A]
MLKEQLRGNCQFLQQAETWQQAIEMAARPLLQKGIIQPSYIEAMIQNVKDNGNYIIILPKIAMPHARPELGSSGIGISFMKLEQPVMFPKEEPVEQFFVLASNSPDGHLELMADLAGILSDTERYEALLEIQNEEELLAVIEE